MTASPAAPVVTETAVRRELNQVLDPCSVTAGCPAGLVDMGLVREVRVDGAPAGAVVSVTLGITEPGCLMAAPFVVRATERLGALEGVSSVDVQVDAAAPWDESLLAPEYSSRLQAHRAVRRQQLHLELAEHRDAVT